MSTSNHRHSHHPGRAQAGAALLALSLLSSCGGGAEALIIPLFEFGFSGTTGATKVDMFFVPDTPTSSSGSFSGVNVSINGAPSILYDGTYANCTFTLSLHAGSVAAPIAAGYNGRFLSNDSIELAPTSGAGLPTLTLKRLGTSQRQMGC
ncbi:hypothetical protein [Pelomonas sp. Root1444]|uniref:hypothetical protein n=1 Tax=Pelomonas sp. Root1444 TaxID=1736464 RepID=UPI000702EBD4|nr:hypothetical protein [Pelomonas sp. Root1444]KQY90423.1 hypothetical protein ASD35_01000 [Pelomonas sp. Root1444]